MTEEPHTKVELNFMWGFLLLESDVYFTYFSSINLYLFFSQIHKTYIQTIVNQ